MMTREEVGKRNRWNNWDSQIQELENTALALWDVVEAAEKMLNCCQDTWASGRPEACMDRIIDDMEVVIKKVRGE